MTFNNKITIQKQTITQDEIGNEDISWTDLYVVYAYINSLYGAEYYTAAAYNQENTITFTMRWFKALDELNLADYRIIFNDVPYEIKSVDNVEYRNRVVKIKAVCKEV